jgi:hypothetical protein
LTWYLGARTISERQLCSSLLSSRRIFAIRKHDEATLFEFSIIFVFGTFVSDLQNVTYLGVTGVAKIMTIQRFDSLEGPARATR